METFDSSRMFLNNVTDPPPSPEGELMETILLVRLVGLNKTAAKLV